MCHGCGADLRPDVRWCLRCYAPVRHLSPREPQLPTVNFVHRNERARSRWRAGATTFGPAGRLVVTAIVLLLAPWSAGAVTVIVVWPCYLVLAAIVLHSTWRRDLVRTPDRRRRSRPGGL